MRNRNRKKDLILDFTSLLDIVLLLLFFFLLFSRQEVTDAQKSAEMTAEAAKAEAQMHIAEADRSREHYESLVQENNALREELDRDIEIVRQVTPKEADEILSFNKGRNLKLLLLDEDGRGGPMTLRVLLDRKVIGECLVTEKADAPELQAEDVNLEKLTGWLSENGIRKDSVVMCDFIYNGSMPRTSRAYDKLTGLLTSIQGTGGYHHFYCSSTDLSTGGR